ncbi:SDR family NAD(P)-dependent oxidoreductase [Aequorivita sp. SDUM287046]|uniref:SDR family NAD(P)-dependent oxidoreductase n=1 Tax=Aequorivita aurantiaca TaxID=3053356 RepID=A0ABT8DIY3_9FLAO|nr:SDR family NAD(P)-dependent oxidoreductase [Aequorivita aurantiaca]MDN3725336.1 SDR family NAD(P)-dependent oxidoreductase [Aequorivita aurantiaca]
MKKAIVIGASSGIGFQLATILSKNNYRVGITGRRAAELENLMTSNPQNFLCSAFDCTKESNPTKLEELVSRMQGLDLLVFCAGTGDLNGKLEYEIENRTNQLNVNAFTEIAVWACNFFEKQGKGHFVAISSLAGIRGNHLAPAYNASKAYQINYLEGLRQKAKRSKKPIYITDVRPGFVDTDMAKGEGLFWVASKENAANQIYELIKRKKDVGYVTKRWRAVAILLKILPNSIYKRM